MLLLSRANRVRLETVVPNSRITSVLHRSSGIANIQCNLNRLRQTLLAHSHNKKGVQTFRDQPHPPHNRDARTFRITVSSHSQGKISVISRGQARLLSRETLNREDRARLKTEALVSRIASVLRHPNRLRQPPLAHSPPNRDDPTLRIKSSSHSQGKTSVTNRRQVHRARMKDSKARTPRTSPNRTRGKSKISSEVRVTISNAG